MAIIVTIRQTLRSLLASLALLPFSLQAAGLSPFDFLAETFDATRSLFSGDARYLFRPTAKTIDGLTEDFGHLIAARGYSAQRPLGAGNFEFGLSIETTRLAHADLWLQATGEAYRKADLPRLHFRAGLPYAINVGAAYYRNPASDVAIQSLDIARQFVPESADMPALALSVATTRLVGVRGVALRSHGVNLTASREFHGFTPYVGLGYARTVGNYSGPAALPFDMRAAHWRAFLGGEVRFGVLALSAEIGGKRGASDAGIRVAARF